MEKKREADGWAGSEATAVAGYQIGPVSLADTTATTTTYDTANQYPNIYQCNLMYKNPAFPLLTIKVIEKYFPSHFLRKRRGKYTYFFHAINSICKKILWGILSGRIS